MTVDRDVWLQHLWEPSIVTFGIVLMAVTLVASGGFGHDRSARGPGGRSGRAKRRCDNVEI